VTKQFGTGPLASRSQPAAVRFLGNMATIHAPSAATGERYALVEMLGPAGSQTPLHVHHDDNEGFYVLDGRLRVHAGANAVVLGPGEFFLAESGPPHAVIVGPGQPPRWLVTSGGGFDRFVISVAAAGERTEADVGRIAGTFGIEILGPPGALPASLSWPSQYQDEPGLHGQQPVGG
jgi:quercetin dioxygenase-like cupin family protein